MGSVFALEFLQSMAKTKPGGKQMPGLRPANTQGMARRSRRSLDPHRREGREPSRICSIKSMGVAWRK